MITCSTPGLHITLHIKQVGYFYISVIFNSVKWKLNIATLIFITSNKDRDGLKDDL